MSDPSNVGYSEDATVTAFRDYYRFLATMYLDESVILEPPEGGWPHITPGYWKGFNKTEEVFSLLRRLPYVTMGPRDAREMQTVPNGRITNYAEIPSTWDGESIKSFTEYFYDGQDDDLVVTPYIIGLVDFERNGPRIFLDTKCGVVYWPNCPGEVLFNTPGYYSIEDPAIGTQSLVNSPEDENEETDGEAKPEEGEALEEEKEEFEEEEDEEDEPEWQTSGGVWDIKDFFDMLKFHFRELNFLPKGMGRVTDIWVPCLDSQQAEVDEITKAFKEHGWPDPSRFRKEGCVAAVRENLDVPFP